MSFRPILKFENDLSAAILNTIYANGRFIINGKIDQSFGSGQVSKNCKAVWTTEGKRIEVELGPAFIISQSREVDPLYAERKRRYEPTSNQSH